MSDFFFCDKRKLTIFDSFRQGAGKKANPVELYTETMRVRPLGGVKALDEVCVMFCSYYYSCCRE